MRIFATLQLSRCCDLRIWKHKTVWVLLHRMEKGSGAYERMTLQGSYTLGSAAHCTLCLDNCNLNDRRLLECPFLVWIRGRKYNPSEQHGGDEKNTDQALVTRSICIPDWDSGNRIVRTYKVQGLNMLFHRVLPVLFFVETMSTPTLDSASTNWV